MARGLFVHTSNRLEELLEALATVLGHEPLPPLTDDVVAVPSQGIARWLRLRLAERFSIAASLRLPFLGAFFAGLGESPGALLRDPLAKDTLAFHCWRILRDPASARDFAPAADYCRDDPDDHKRLQLCLLLARVFDDYQVYRPDLLRRWSAGDDGKDLGAHGPWQARLWRRLLHDLGVGSLPPPAAASVHGQRPLPFAPAATTATPGHQPIRLLRVQQLLADPVAARTVLPPRLSVFGAGTLPPTFLDLLARCSDHVPVHLFVPQPAPFADGDSGNALLASFGQQARELAVQLAAIDETGARPVHRFELAALAGRKAQPAATLLQHLQQQIADLEPRPEPAPRHAIAAADDSLRVHDCHSRQRELEVVRDQILAAFAADPTLQPHDVFVLVPDIEAYAAFAHAVFGPVADHLPFHVADRSPANELPVCSTLFAILRLAASRVEVHDVFRILEEPAVHRRFRLFPGDLPLLRERCERAGIRWGIDAEARARSCRIPPFDDNAWRPGLERLLFGVATGPLDELVLGVLPCADATSSRDDALARFATFVETLFGKLEPLSRPQSPGSAADLVDDLLGSLFEPAGADDDAALARVRTATARLREITAATALRDALSPVVLRTWLEQALQQAATARGFLAGAVTVAALTPMRTVPARCLFVCGLDDASFPRRHAAVGFDLVAAHRRPGDRDARLDDRQLFLDVLLAARDRLHLCYVGHSQKDDSECAPSVLLAELLDHLDRCCTGGAADRPARDAVLVRHPLQPWSDRYRRGDPRLFTFSRARSGNGGPRDDEAPWFRDPVAPPPELIGRELPLARLLEFWRSPPRYFLKEIAGVYVRDDSDAEATTEPFALDALDRWRIQDQVVRLSDRQPTAAQRLAFARAMGQLPAFGHGDAVFTELDDVAQAFLTTVATFGERRRAGVCAALDDVVVAGDLEGVTATCILRHRMATLRTKDRLGAWIVHVVAAVARHSGQADLPECTVVLGKDARAKLRPLGPDEARAQLRLLVDGHCAGVRAPLPFFHETSAAFAAQRDRARALQAARKEWLPSWGEIPRESEDAANKLCFRGREALELPEFATWATAVFGAMAQCGALA